MLIWPGIIIIIVIIVIIIIIPSMWFLQMEELLFSMLKMKIGWSSNSRVKEVEGNITMKETGSKPLNRKDLDSDVSWFYN